MVVGCISVKPQKSEIIEGRRVNEDRASGVARPPRRGCEWREGEGVAAEVRRAAVSIVEVSDGEKKRGARG